MTVDVGHLVEAGAVALLTFVAAWTALRSTVASMKEDVASLKSLVVTAELLKAKTTANELETEKLRNAMHTTRSHIQDILIRVGRAETLIDEARRDIEETKP